MKNALENILRGASLVAVLGLLGPLPALAADTLPPAISMPPGPASNPPELPKFAPPNVNKFEEMHPLKAEEARSGKNDDAGEVTLSDVKIPQSVKDVVKHLSNETSDITLDDLNDARQAIARLDALIEIEKHLADLDKIRQEREGKSLASAIPASALRPVAGLQPISLQPPPLPMPTSAAPIRSSSNYEVERIEGGAGHFTAFIKGPDGTVKPVHEGEHLSDGSIVISIGAQGVGIDHDKTMHLLPVKDVQAVFSGSP